MSSCACERPDEVDRCRPGSVVIDGISLGTSQLYKKKKVNTAKKSAKLPLKRKVEPLTLSLTEGLEGGLVAELVLAGLHDKSQTGVDTLTGLNLLLVDRGHC